jgi:DeoR/GlpR family transcriptional regulator of sugar metabolism
MAEVSREVVVMVESDKVGRKIPNLELPWEDIDVLVTDKGLSDELVAKIESHQVRVIRA